MIRRLLISFALLIIIAIGFAFYANISISKAGRIGIYTASDVPQAEAAIVLGAKVLKGDQLTDVLKDRVETGIEIYKNGKVKKLLMTGDHGQTSYDEVNAMRKYALAKGVPDEDIFMDHAGFSTHDSMYRARDVFMVNSAVIVTQEFHLPRALYIARGMGIKASGVKADKRNYSGINYLYFREVFARTKAAAYLAIGKKPKFLGPVIPISGDGRVTKG